MTDPVNALDVATTLALGGTLLLGSALALMVILRRRAAADRHVVASAALLGAGLLPLVALVPLRLHWLHWLPGTESTVEDAEPEETAAAPFLPREATPRPAELPAAFVSVPELEAAETAEPMIAGQADQGAVTIETATRASADGPAPARGGAAPWLTTPLLVLWLLGTLVLVIRLARGVVAARRASSRTSAPDPRFQALFERKRLAQGAPARTRLAVSRDLDAPLTTGILRPLVIAPADLAWQRSAAAAPSLAHELAHVRRRDVLWQLVGHLACAVHWWNPLAWAVARKQRQDAEFACDDAVLLRGVAPEDYAGCLVDAARRFRPGPGALELAMATPVGLAERVEAALDRRRVRGLAPGAAARVLGAAALALCVTTATLRAGSPAAPFTAAETITVAPDGSGDHTTIQAAIDAAPAGATIEVAPGRYDEALKIEGELTLRGSGWESCRVVNDMDARDGATLTISGGADVKVSGIGITATGGHVSGRLRQGAALVIDGATARLEGCAVLGSPASAIYVKGDADVELLDSLVAAAWAEGIVITQGDEGKGRVLVKGCAVRNNHHYGIKVSGSAPRTRIEGCWVSGSAWHGIRYDGSRCEVVGNRIFGNERSGIYASGKTAARVEGNLFQDTGISCWYQNGDTIKRNTFIGNPAGGSYASATNAVAVIGKSTPVVTGNVMVGWPKALGVSRIGGGGENSGLSTEYVFEDNVLWKNGDGAREGNVEGDPGFASAEEGDFALAEGSFAARSGAGAPECLPPASPFPLQEEEKALAEGPDSVKARTARQREEAAEQARARVARTLAEDWIAGALQVRDAELRKTSMASILEALTADREELQDAGLTALLRVREVAFDRAPYAAAVRALAKSRRGGARVQALYGLANTRAEATDADLQLLLDALQETPDAALFGSASHLLTMFAEMDLTGPAGDAALALFKDGKADTREVLRGMWGARVSPALAAHVIELAKKGSRHRHDAIYFGLSTYNNKSIPVVEALFEACEDPDPNNSGRARWGLTYGVAEEARGRVADYMLLLFEARHARDVREDCLRSLATYADTSHLPKLRELAGLELLGDEVTGKLRRIIAGLEAKDDGK